MTHRFFRRGKKCPKCGSMEGVVFAPTGEVLSCVGCSKAVSENAAAEQRVARKDEIDRTTLSAASRSATKDVIDLSTKVAGVTIAAAALFKANERTEKPPEFASEALPCRTIEPLPVRESHGLIVLSSPSPTYGILLKEEAGREMEYFSRDTGFSITELTGIALGLLKCLIEQNRMGNKIIVATASKKPIYEIILPNQ